MLTWDDIAGSGADHGHEAVVRGRGEMPSVVPTDRAFADRLCTAEQVRYVGRGE